MSTELAAAPSALAAETQPPHLVECRLGVRGSQWQTFEGLTLKDAAIALYCKYQLKGDALIETRFAGHPSKIWPLRVRMVATFDVRGMRGEEEGDDANCD